MKKNWRVGFFTGIFASMLLFSCATGGKIENDEKNISIEQPSATVAIEPAKTETAENVESIETTEEKDEEKEEPPKELTLVFAGDIMAHKPNYINGKFNKIWEDIKDFVSDSDFAFANIEAPVNDDIEWNTYPQFNMHGEYVQAAINTGFNVFSLSNNHTNDQYLNGIQGTKKYFEGVEKKSSSSERKIYACGLKDKENGPLTYRIIEKDGWKILFVAITEILNAPVAKENIDYYPTSDKNHEFLISEMKRLKKENGCNLSIFSVHTDEPEYVRAVTESHKKFFKSLVEEASVDIIWANHPHIVKKYEMVSTSLVMYANGNTISAQRTNPSWDAPSTARDDTGDGLILKVKVKNPERPTFEISDPYIITTYIDPNGLYVVRHLDENFIKCFRRLNYEKKASYFERRLEITKKATK